MVNLIKFIRERKLRPLLLELLFVLILAIALGHAGPYGTYERFDLETRMVFWVVVISLPWSISKVLFFLAKHFAPENLSKRYISVMLMPLLALLGSAAVSLISLKVGLYQGQSFVQVWPTSILVWLVFAFFIVLPMIFIGGELAREQRKVGVTTMMEFFHHKLPDSIKNNQLIALKAEDHYLRIITDGGSALILMKFEDALAALNGYPGIQTHRSWWLAYSQLQDLEVIASSVSLQDGTKVPISRRRKKAVQLSVEEFKAAQP